MHRIDGPAIAPGGFFTEGDPSVGTPATVMTDDWANSVQEELCNAITGAGIALSKPNNQQLFNAIVALVSQRVPAGAVHAFAFSAVPAGWLKCNGQAVSRTGFAALFSAIGTTFGAGNGTTTFTLPDLRGEFIRGWDDGRGVDVGRGLGTSQSDMFKSHTHDLGSESGGGGNFATVVDSGGVDEAPTGNPSQAAGGAETRPRNVALQWCIRT